MSRITFTLRAKPELPLDLSSLNPATLAGRRLPQIRAMKLQQGRRRVPLGDWFEIEGETDASTLVLEGAAACLHRVGAGLSSGSIEVHGDVGHEAGLRMRGGLLRISGNAGDGVGLGMRGGVIDIEGNAGSFAGAPAPGDVTGMKNGTILVGGNVGERAGDRMRRGLLAVGGNAAAFCGSQMVAGSIVVLGDCGAGLGVGMRRGSIVLSKPTGIAGHNFQLAGEFELAFLPLLVRYLSGLKPLWSARLARLTKVQRWVGDAGNGGMGEILIARRR